MEYTIAYARGQRCWEVKQELEKEVKGLIEEGWRPEGCASLAFSSATEDVLNIYMIQSMVKDVSESTATTTHEDVIYESVWKEAKLVGIKEKSKEGEEVYYFNPAEGELEVTNELLEATLNFLLRTNPGAFDIMAVGFYGLEKQEECKETAVSIFKKYWNELYNLSFADEIFGRESTFDSIGKTYDFFAEKKE